MAQPPTPPPMTTARARSRTARAYVSGGHVIPSHVPVAATHEEALRTCDRSRTPPAGDGHEPRKPPSSAQARSPWQPPSQKPHAEGRRRPRRRRPLDRQTVLSLVAAGGP